LPIVPDQTTARQGRAAYSSVVGVLVVVYQRPRVKKPSSKRTSTTIKMIQSKLTVRHLLSAATLIPR
jgi:hypothetical protein